MVLFCSGFLFLGLAYAGTPWEFMRGAEVSPQPERTYTAGQPLRPMFRNDVVSDSTLAMAARDSAALSRARLAKKGVTPSPSCGLGTPIEIYAWPGVYVPVETIMPREHWGAPIVGIYLPNSVDRVVLVPSGPRETYRILVHEFAHAWYERACAHRTLKETSEAFASAVHQLALDGWHTTRAPVARVVAPPPTLVYTPPPAVMVLLPRPSPVLLIKQTRVLIEQTDVLIEPLQPLIVTTLAPLFIPD